MLFYWRRQWRVFWDDDARLFWLLLAANQLPRYQFYHPALFLEYAHTVETAKESVPESIHLRVFTSCTVGRAWLFSDEQSLFRDGDLAAKRHRTRSSQLTTQNTRASPSFVTIRPDRGRRRNAGMLVTKSSLAAS